MENMLTLARMDGEVVAIIGLAGGLGLAAIGMLTRFATGIVRTKAHEESRREISAYVAEGSITAEEGERLINAGPKKDSCGW